MKKDILGIHHITAIAGAPQENLNFYVGILGLRLVKQTVNFDDPGIYHLYYGDEVGNPGTILTFFPWPGAPRGRTGTGQAMTISLSIPKGSLAYWQDRLRSHGVSFERPLRRFEEEVISFSDPDGLRLELVAHPHASRHSPWREGPVAPEHGIRGLHSLALWEKGHDRTAALLTGSLGFRPVAAHGNRFRYEVGTGGPGALVDVVALPLAEPGLVAVGTIHHVAWRVSDAEEQKGWRHELLNAGLSVTPVVDRKYFSSIYFREPGGVLFEIATDPPGFTVDEGVQNLGNRLMLPPWLEQRRGLIERVLPPLRLPEPGRGRAVPLVA
jgi:glyoxalase family protein